MNAKMENITIHLTLKDLEDLVVAVAIAMQEVFPSGYHDYLDKLYRRLDALASEHNQQGVANRTIMMGEVK